MLHSFNAAAVIALTFSSLASATPVPADVSVLEPVTKGSFGPSTLSALHGLDRRDNATISNNTAATNVTILAPISKAKFTTATLGALNSLRKRDEANSTITPQSNVTLYFASSDTAASNIVAELNATMKYPSVLLEDITSVTDVNCSSSSVAITFSDAATFASSLELWSAETFLLFTNHLGNCDTDAERGIYMVNGVQSNNATLVITAESVETTFSNSTETMDISFLTPTTTTAAKRDLLSTFIGSFPTSVVVANDSSLTITATDTSLTGSLDLAGHISFNFWKFKFTKFYFDLDLSASAATNIDVEVTASYDDSIYTYSPLDLTIAAFSIAGILSIGPQISFELGVEVSAEGSVGISTELTASLADGVVHLDLLDSTSSYTSGWTPTFTHDTNITAAIESQVNPYVKLTAEIGANLLNGLIDLSAGISLKPEILNVFDVNADFEISNTNNVTFPVSTNATCANGLWFASSFVFDVTAFVTSLYTVTLYEYTAPIYESGCWSWA
ncbi:hypothetical protein DL98DRAFT_460787 [Cadophora sp. DSE1049]|nr:hypothetical protein DL98DRAFT_460787 [Cadophora sp. DSE1049]